MLTYSYYNSAPKKILSETDVYQNNLVMNQVSKIHPMMFWSMLIVFEIHQRMFLFFIRKILSKRLCGTLHAWVDPSNAETTFVESTRFF